MKRKIGRFLLIPFVVLVIPIVASAQQPRMISIGERRVAVYCDGVAGRSARVILLPPGGSTAKDWAKVQPTVSTFTRTCSYDHANHGASDKAPSQIQSVDEVVDELHAWLKASSEKKGPFIL